MDKNCRVALKQEKQSLKSEILSYARIVNFLTESQLAILEAKAARIEEIEKELKGNK